jgi:hypothetical protein
LCRYQRLDSIILHPENIGNKKWDYSITTNSNWLKLYMQARSPFELEPQAKHGFLICVTGLMEL